jgi:hypothetical protein
MADIYFLSIKVYRSNQAIFIAADIEHNQISDHIGAKVFFRLYFHYHELNRTLEFCKQKILLNDSMSRGRAFFALA